MSFSHRNQGTSEADWATGGVPALPELPLSDAELRTRRFVVLAAHPDDETLGAGGLVASLVSLGAALEVLVCTAGEGSHPESPTFTPQRLGAVRLEEFAAALTALGVKDHWHYLDLPDRGLETGTGTVAAAIRDAARRLSAAPGSEAKDVVLVAPYRADGHADHDALGSVAAQVAAVDGHGLLEYPLWYWHWATPDHPGWRAWLRFHLGESAQAAKERAMRAHTTQIQPLSPAAGDEVLLDEEFLRHFSRNYEVFAWTPPLPADARALHRSADAERVFDAIHAKAEDPWNYLSSWYEQRKRALTLAALPKERYSSALEVGCSIGALTADLAPRCTGILAVDASGTAVRSASDRLASSPGVRVRQLTLPDPWPEGVFDLVVVSEVGYYLASDELAVLLERIEASVEPGGTLLLCHWRHPVDGWELDGDAVHAMARERLRWRTASVYQERDFILEVLLKPEASPAGQA